MYMCMCVHIYIYICIRDKRTHTQTHTHTRSQYPKHHKSIVCLQWCNAVPGMPWLWSTDLALNGL